MEEAAYPYQSKRSKSKLAVVIGLALLVTAIVGGIFYMRQPKKTVNNTPVIVTTVPTPTEKPVIDKSTVRIQVVNGTGIAGQASDVMKALADAGYNTANIQSANASAYDNTVATVTGRTNFDEIVNDIVTVLKPTFSNIAVSSSKLDETSSFDIVVLTGNPITATPTTSPTGSVSPTVSPTETLTPTPSVSPSPTVSLTTTP